MSPAKKTAKPNGNPKNALPGARSNQFNLDPDDVVYIGVDTPHKQGEHPLWDFDEDRHAIDESMIASMLIHGVKDPIDVVVLGEDKEDEHGIVLVEGKWQDGDRVVVIEGRRRLLNVREANKRLLKQGEDAADLIKVPCIKKKVKDALDLMIIGNELRMADPLPVKVSKLETWLVRNPDDYEGAAIRFGVTAVQIKNWLKYPDLAPKVQKAVENGELSFHAALEFHGMDAGEQAEALQKAREEAPEGKKITAKKARQSRSNTTGEAPKNTAPGKRVLKRLVLGHGIYATDVPEDFIKGLRYALGELDAKSVKGLIKLLKDSEDV